MNKPNQSTSEMRRTPRALLNISSQADKTDPDLIKVRFTLTEQNGKEIYTRTYDCTIDDTDHITFPNDLTSRIQTLCRAICLCQKYPNTYEGDS